MEILPNIQNHRRGSYYPLDPSSQRTESLDSLYSSKKSNSISLLEASSSADSVAINQIQSINNELEHLITSRLTAFLYFQSSAIKTTENFSQLSIIEPHHPSSDHEMSQFENESVLFLSDYTKKITTLNKKYQKELIDEKSFL